MANVIDICNTALADIGHGVQITSIVPPDGSREAALCSTFYPLARDFLLSQYEWGFALRRESLAQVGTAPSGWDYQYAMPAQALRILRLTDPDDDTPASFTVERDATHGTVILTDLEAAALHYIVRVDDVTKYPPAFVQAVAWQLASHLAGPIAKDPKLAQYCESRALHTAGQAAVNDARAQTERVRLAIQSRFTRTYIPE